MAQSTNAEQILFVPGDVLQRKRNCARFTITRVGAVDVHWWYWLGGVGSSETEALVKAVAEEQLVHVPGDWSWGKIVEEEAKT